MRSYGNKAFTSANGDQSMETCCRRVLTGLTGLIGLCLLGGCYNANEVNAFLRESPSPVVATEYRILPPDVIAIRSTKVPEINGVSQRVRPDGKINLPLVSEITVAGLTPKEIETEIIKAAGEYYESVDATVDVVTYNSQSFYVLGQVLRSGPQPFTGRDTLLHALAIAQPNTLAWPERIRVVRGAHPQQGGYATSQPSKKYHDTGVHPETPDRPRHEMTVNLLAMAKSGDMANNIMLMPGDVVYVPATPFAAVGLALQNLLFPTRPVLEAARVPATLSGAAP